MDWIRARSAPGAFEFLSFHSGDLERRFPFLDREACRAAAHMVLPDGTILVGERIGPEVLARLPGHAWLARILRFPGVRIFSRAFYRWFARRRHAIAALLSSGHGDA